MSSRLEICEYFSASNSTDPRHSARSVCAGGYRRARSRQVRRAAPLGPLDAAAGRAGAPVSVNKRAPINTPRPTLFAPRTLPSDYLSPLLRPDCPLRFGVKLFLRAHTFAARFCRIVSEIIARAIFSRVAELQRFSVYSVLQYIFEIVFHSLTVRSRAHRLRK